MAPILLSTTAYARHRGIAGRSVRKAIETGRLKHSVHRQGRSYLIDRKAADAEWTANTAQGWGGKRTCSGEFAEARRRRVCIEADLLSHTLADRQASLTDPQEVERIRRHVAMEVEAQLMRLPDRLAPVLATETDAFKVHSLIMAALRAALERIATSIG